MRPVPQQALDLVKASEGFRASRNTDPTGNAEIGYGHKLMPGDPLWNATLSEESAESLAMDDLEHVAQELTTILGDALVSELTEGQWAALLDFTFNEGAGRFEGSTLCAMVKTGQFADAAGQFGRWVYGCVNGSEVKLPGLVTRRAAETALWQS